MTHDANRTTGESQETCLEVVQYVEKWGETERVTRGRFALRHLAEARARQVERGPYPKVDVLIEEVPGPWLRP